MKKLISILLLVFIIISCVACQTPGDETKETEAPEETKTNYRPENPNDINVSEDELEKGYRIYEGFFYYEGGAKYFCDSISKSIYQLPQLIEKLMPSDFYDGFNTGDTIRIKAVEKSFAGNYQLEGKQIALVSDGDASSIPAEILEKFVEKDAPNHES